MFEILITFAILLGIVSLMSVGLFFGKKPITGSCGGLNNLEPGRECELCGGKPSDCLGE
tara:strand:+ start:329 stop:505 length:177 start_codon:yes stop_codon:yes gene_type:complete